MIELIVIIIVIIVIGIYIMNQPNHVYAPITLDQPISHAAPVPPPISYKYATMFPSGVWSNDAPGKLVCPNATGVNLTGDYADYCVFNNAQNAINYCNNEPSCGGYVHVGDRYQIASSASHNPTMNGEYVVKQADIAKLLASNGGNLRIGY